MVPLDRFFDRLPALLKWIAAFAVAAGLVLGTVQPVHAAAADLHRHGVPAGIDHPDDSDDTEHAHAALHCVGFYCSPSLPAGGSSVAPSLSDTAAALQHCEDGFQTSLLADTDPPVPRSEIGNS